MTIATSPYLNQDLRTHEQALFDRTVADRQDAGNWPVSMDPWDEIERQQAISDAAHDIIRNAENALIKLATQSQDHRSVVNADQDDWLLIITASLQDMVNDTFGCLPKAIARAKREC